MTVRSCLRIVCRQLGGAVVSRMKFASLRGLKVGRLNAGLEPLDQLLAREPRGGVATMGTEISPLPSSRVPGERPLTAARGAVGEHPRTVVPTEGSDWIIDGMTGCGTDEHPASSLPPRSPADDSPGGVFDLSGEETTPHCCKLPHRGIGRPASTPLF